MAQEKHVNMKFYHPFRGASDPCPSIGAKYYSTPPQLYLGFQPAGLDQFSSREALKIGTLWPIFYDYYENPYKKGREG